MNTGWNLALDELQKAVNGKPVSEVVKAFSGVVTDSRQALAGKLFIPLKGERHDAHDFVTQAVTNGAAGVMVQAWRAEWKALTNLATFVMVPDTLLALQSLARFWRRKHAFKVAAITGSNGKTSTKEFTAHLLREKFSVGASKGSYNNHWGVPLTLLSAGPEQTHLVVEMGMNKKGEIFRLCQIAEPDIVAVTNVGRAHIGELGSQDAVAAAKEEIYIACPKAIHVFNVDNEWTMRMETRSQAQKVRFSAFKNTVEVYLRAQRMNWDGLDLVGTIDGLPGEGWVHVLGRHNVANLSCASAMALAAGLEPARIWTGLREIEAHSWGRNQMLQLNNGARVLFDAYNSNPDSVTALFKNLYEMDIPGRKFLIMGDMKELGNFADAAHQEAGEKAASVGFEGVWFIGQHGPSFIQGLTKTASPRVVEQSLDVDPGVNQQFLAGLKEGDLVAIKGSRGMALEKVLASWPLQTPLGEKP